MSRTQIYLEKSQLDALRKEAVRRQATVSEIIRAMIRENISPKRESALARKHESLLSVATRINALGDRAPQDIASHLDTYLYGA